VAWFSLIACVRADMVVSGHQLNLFIDMSVYQKYIDLVNRSFAYQAVCKLLSSKVSEVPIPSIRVRSFAHFLDVEIPNQLQPDTRLNEA